MQRDETVSDERLASDGWTLCRNQMPPRGKRVQILRTGGLVQTAAYKPSPGCECNWHYGPRQGWLSGISIRAWRPLPAAPTDGKEQTR
jgi:hypothetical protein